MPVDINGAIAAIVSDEFPAWTVLLGYGAYNVNNLLDESEFYDLKIEAKMNTIPTASLIFVNKKEDDLQDIQIRIYLDGVKKFAGYIRKCSDAYRSTEVAVECLGLEFDIQKKNVTKIKDFRFVKTSEIISKWLNPNVIEVDGETSWLEEDMGTSPTGWRLNIDDSVNDFVINYRLESGNFLQHINTLCVKNYWEWWTEEKDSESGLAKRYFYIAPYRGKESPSVTFSIEKTAYNAIIDKNKEKLKNAVLVSGSSSQMSNTSTTASGFFDMGDEETPTAMGYVIGNESYLSKPAYIGDTEIHLEDVSGYTTPGEYRIQIGEDGPYYVYDEVVDDGDEKKLVFIDGVKLTAAYPPGTPILMIDLLRAYVPASVTNWDNKVWIGNECIEYESVSTWGLEKLTRGVKPDGIHPTPQYAHGDGTKIFSGANSLTNPDTNSSIASYGQVDSRISNVGSADRDGLDKYGTSVLLTSQKYEQFGTFIVSVDKLSTVVIGDAFYLKEYGSDTQILRRCMGLNFDGDIVTITFGLNEDYILNQFESVTRIDNATYVKQDLNAEYDVVEVSDDGKSVKICYDNEYDQNTGVKTPLYKWIRMV